MAFNEATISAVWAKGKEIPDFESAVWRWDALGAVMKFAEYGNRDSKHGWEIDHIKPVADEGKTVLSNLQPLNWKQNIAKSDN